MSSLETMVAAARPASSATCVRALSHGTQMDDRGGDEPDGKDEAFVPHDIAEKNGKWDPARIISDDELHDLFASLPNNVAARGVPRHLHSGSGLRGAEFGLHAPRPAISRRPTTSSRKGRPGCAGSRCLARARPRRAAKALVKDVAGQHHVLWTGCKSNQTSADAYFDAATTERSPTTS